MHFSWCSENKPRWAMSLYSKRVGVARRIQWEFEYMFYFVLFDWSKILILSEGSSRLYRNSWMISIQNMMHKPSKQVGYRSKPPHTYFLSMNFFIPAPLPSSPFPLHSSSTFSKTRRVSCRNQPSLVSPSVEAACCRHLVAPRQEVSSSLISI